MSKIYPRHGGGQGSPRSSGAGSSGERFRSAYENQGRRQRQQQQQQQQQGYQRQQRSGEEQWFPSTFTILCSIPVIFILYHYFCKILSKIIWGSLTLTVEVCGPRLDHPSFGTDDSIYVWLMEWLAKNSRNLTSASVRLDKKTGRLVRYPGFGITTIQYKGSWVRLERSSTPEIRSNEVPFEKIQLTFVSTRSNRTLLYELLDECKPNCKRRAVEENRTLVYEVERAPTSTGAMVLRCWKPSAPKGKMQREWHTVILADTLKDRLKNDVKDFLGAREWYADRGIPYRRSYLLYGPSGCGKSTLIKALAGEFGFDICSFSLTTGGVTDDALKVLMNQTPDHCLIVVEDVDAVLTNERAAALTNIGSDCLSLVTIGGLLNALDGITATEDGRLVFMTTNQIEKLDPALTRPGRADMKMFIGYPNDDQLKQLYARFYPDAGVKMKGEFVKRVRELGINVTLAQIQGLFMFCKKDGLEAINFMSEYFQDQFLMSELEPIK